MGIEVVWDNEERTIIRHTYRGKWTGAYRLPPKPSSIFREIATFVQHPKVGTVVVTTDSVVVRAFVSIFSKLHPQARRKLLLVASEEEAYHRLSERRHANN
jgi:hypothetical protein